MQRWRGLIRGKKTFPEESSADLLGMRAALDMTLEDMVEEFLINSVRVSLIYDILNDFYLGECYV